MVVLFLTPLQDLYLTLTPHDTALHLDCTLSSLDARMYRFLGWHSHAGIVFSGYTYISV